MYRTLALKVLRSLCSFIISVIYTFQFGLLLSSSNFLG